MGWLRYSLLLPGEGRGAGEGCVISCGVKGLDGVGVSLPLLPAPELAWLSLVLKVLSLVSLFSSARGQEGARGPHRSLPLGGGCCSPCPGPATGHRPSSCCSTASAAPPSFPGMCLNSAHWVSGRGRKPLTRVEVYDTVNKMFFEIWGGKFILLSIFA